MESARVIKRRSERRLGLVGYLELTRQRAPFFSQGPALSSWAWGLGTWVPHWREKMKESFSNTSKHKTDTIFSVRYASQSELTPILPFLVFALLAVVATLRDVVRRKTIGRGSRSS